MLYQAMCEEEEAEKAAESAAAAAAADGMKANDENAMQPNPAKIAVAAGGAKSEPSSSAASASTTSRALDMIKRALRERSINATIM